MSLDGLPRHHGGADDLACLLARHGQVLEAIRRRHPGDAARAARAVLQRTTIDLGIVADGRRLASGSAAPPAAQPRGTSR